MYTLVHDVYERDSIASRLPTAASSIRLQIVEADERCAARHETDGGGDSCCCHCSDGDSHHDVAATARRGCLAVHAVDVFH